MKNVITITAKKAAYPGNLADEYLDLKRRIAELAAEEKVLKDAILATGKPVLEGNFGRVTVSPVEGRVDIDYRAAALGMLSKPVLERYRSKSVAPTYRFNVRARVADAKPEAKAG